MAVFEFYNILVMATSTNLNLIQINEQGKQATFVKDGTFEFENEFKITELFIHDVDTIIAVYQTKLGQSQQFQSKIVKL